MDVSWICVRANLDLFACCCLLVWRWKLVEKECYPIDEKSYYAIVRDVGATVDNRKAFIESKLNEAVAGGS